MKTVEREHSKQIKTSSGERGVTLIELVVATTIATLLVTAVFQFFSTQSSSFIESRQNAEMQQELRWAMQFLSENVKLAGNGVPPISVDGTGFQVIDNANGANGASDSLSIIGSFRSLVITLDQNMGNEGAQIKCSDKGNVPPIPVENLLEVGDLAVISDGTFTEVFKVTNLSASHIWHEADPPWNPTNKLDHRYTTGSTVLVVTHYSFFVQTDATGNSNLMVKTQAYPAQILAGNVDQFQVRFNMKSGQWLDDISADEVEDIRRIEITVRARSEKPIPGYNDPLYHDAYKRIELRTVIIPKNLVKNI